MSAPPLTWLGIVRLGLVQTALGSIVVLNTSTINRVMVVELALPAMLPGALVALHYAVQILRPRWGYGSDVGGRLTPWIIGGMGVLALGGIGSATATAWMGSNLWAGVALAVASFVLIGIGVGASGTSLLVLLAKRVAPVRRPAAATIVWLMMIAGIVVTAMIAGQLLDPFSPDRLVAVACGVAAAAFCLTIAAVAGVEGKDWTMAGADPPIPATSVAAGKAKPSFREAVAQVWSEPQARAFAIFVFVSMLAYSAQDLILEPFAGAVFGLTPGQSTQLAGTQHLGVLFGMVMVAVVGTLTGGYTAGSAGMRVWTVGGCLASAVALFALAVSGFFAPAWPLSASVFALGFANGAYAVAAIGSMMGLAGEGRQSREGVRMGLWGAAQAIAFGCGGFAGAAAVDIARFFMGDALSAYATVFAFEALLFIAAAALATRVGRPAAAASATAATAGSGRYAAETSGG